MAEPQKRDQKAEELKRRFIGVATFCALACAAVVTAGMLHSIHRKADFDAFLNDQVPALGKALDVVIGKLIQGAQLAGLRVQAGEALPAGDAPIRHFLLVADGLRPVIVTSPGQSISMPDAGDLAVRMTLKPGVQQSTLWPVDKPTAMIHCVGIGGARSACGLLLIDDLLGHASVLATRFTGLELRSRASLLASSEYQPDAPTAQAVAPVHFGSDELTLVARADSSFASEFGVYDGRVLVAWAAALLVLLLCFLAWRYRTQARQLALINAVERSRSASDQHIRSTLELVGQAGRMLLWLWREDGQVELFGPWEEEAGISRDGVTTARLAASLVNGEEVMASLQEAISSRAAWSRVYVRMVDGEPLTYQSHGMPYYDAQGSFVGLLGIAANITEALRVQAQATREEAYRAAQTGFLRHMAKEVSAPAMHIQAVVDLLAREFGTEVGTERRRLMDLAAVEARWLAEVVRSSLELMNLRGTPVLDDLRPVSLDQVIANVGADVTSGEAQRRAQRFAFDYHPSDEVLTHAPSLTELLRIVMVNACRYSPDGSMIFVRAYRDGPVARIEVEDEGPGIAQDELQRIGEPFYRGEASIRIPGSGLGLATAFELARVISGDVRILNSKAEDRGLLVRVSVPLRQ